MASQTWTAMNGTPGVTLTTIGGTPYRPDGDGIIYVLSSDVTEMTARGFTTTTAAQLAANDANSSGTLTQVTGNSGGPA